MRKLEDIQITFIKKASSSINEDEPLVIKTIPPSLAYSYSPKFVSQNLLGRVVPVYQYAGGSGKSISFSLDLHEDIHPKPGETLDSLVQKIRSLAAPVVDTSGYTKEYPKVLFMLGEIEAFVKVEVDVEWHKPIRNGKYIMATVGFKLNILEELKEITTTSIYEDVGGDIVGFENLHFGDTMSYILTQEEVDNFNKYNIANITGINLNNFIISDYDLRGDHTQHSAWDAEVLKMKGMFGAYQETYGNYFEASKSKNNVNITKILNTMYELPATEKDYNKLKNDLEKIAKDNKTIIEHYYYEEGLTSVERDRAIQFLDRTIKTMLDIASGVVGNGAAP